MVCKLVYLDHYSAENLRKKLRLLINSAKQQRLCKGHCIHSCLRIHWHYIQNEMGPEDQGRFGTVSYGFILHAE